MLNKNQDGIVTELLIFVIIIGAVVWFVFTRVHNAQG